MGVYALYILLLCTTQIGGCEPFVDVYRLNLGFSAASTFLAAAVVFAPRFAVGYDMYPFLLKVAAAASHAFAAVLCAAVWVRTTRPIGGHWVPRVVRGLIGSLWALAPRATSLDDPDVQTSRDGRNEYAFCTAGSCAVQVALRTSIPHQC